MARAREVIGDGGGAAAAVESALRCLGAGVHMAGDLRLRHCKAAGGCLVARSLGGNTAAVALPGIGVVDRKSVV